MQYRVSWIWACAIAWALSACTTPVGPVVRDQSYQKKLADTTVVWVERPGIEGQMTKTGPQGVQFSESDRAKARDDGKLLLALFNQLAAQHVSQQLTERQVKLTAVAGTASTRLILQPVRVQTDCTVMMCNQYMLVTAILQEESSFKTIWSASYKVGAPTPFKHDEGVVKDFARNVMYGLKEAGLL